MMREALIAAIKEFASQRYANYPAEKGAAFHSELFMLSGGLADAILALPVGGGVEEGRVLVPREPTEAIILAIAGCKLDEVRLTIAEPSALIVGLKNAPSIWQSIIAALSPRSADGQE